jgi:hypothetical protein
VSEFGKGFSYCLGLFLAHAEKEREDAESWFNSAADHLFEFDAENAPESLRERCCVFKWKCIPLRVQWKRDDICATWDDVKWAIQEAKDILREYDRLNGFETEKGDYE